MNANPALEADLVFDWDLPRRRKVAITGFLAASTVLHALCFYVFQIIYPPTVALLPPPARVSIIAPSSEEARALLRWIEAEDPALASTTQRAPDAKLFVVPKLPHVPSYSGWQPALQEIPPLERDLRVPSSQPPGPVRIARLEKQSPPKVARTVVTFSPEIQGLGQPSAPETSFAWSGREAPQSAQFRIAINERGEVQHCFLQTSSGDPALDEQARHHLALSRFPHRQSHRGLIWATATIVWGNDIVAPPAAPSGTAPP